MWRLKLKCFFFKSKIENLSQMMNNKMSLYNESIAVVFCPGANNTCAKDKTEKKETFI